MHHNQDFITAVQHIVGKKHILTRKIDILPHSTGWRYGGGPALAVIFPQSLYQQWQVLEQCVKYDIISLMQAANTGLNGGSTPYGEDYDRPVVIIKSHKIHQTHLLEKGLQVVAFPGTALYQLENVLSKIDREPHSVIGSSCIGASVIGGVCNNSGGALLQRGPAYTELALFAQLDANGTLHLVNNTGLELGHTPKDILNNIEHGHFQKDTLAPTNRKASGTAYQHEVRQIDQPTPARFNANPEYLYETSGCSGKLAVFAVRLDTFPAPKQKKLFYIGSNDPQHFNTLRRHILKNFKNLPVLAEYLSEQAYGKSRDYARDVYAMLYFFGPRYMPKFFAIKRKTDAYFKSVKIFGKAPIDKFLQFACTPLKFCYPKRILQMGNTYKHHLFLEMSDGGIDEAEAYLKDFCHKNPDIGYILCNEKEHKGAVNFRFATGNGAIRFSQMQNNPHLKMLTYDVAYPRNALDVIENIIPPKIKDALYHINHVSHFFCHVVHQTYLVDTRVCDYDTVDKAFLKFFADTGAKYPAEHNFGNKYTAPHTVHDFYQHLDPCNSFNAGVGGMSKRKFYK